jgi:hypothetical protein
VDKNRVLEALKTLRAELADAEDLDEASRAALVRATDDIERHVVGGQPMPRAEKESLTGKLQEALREFEAEHPTITGAVNQVASALANLGI